MNIRSLYSLFLCVLIIGLLSIGTATASTHGGTGITCDNDQIAFGGDGDDNNLHALDGAGGDGNTEAYTILSYDGGTGGDAGKNLFASDGTGGDSINFLAKIADGDGGNNTILSHTGGGDGIPVTMLSATEGIISGGDGNTKLTAQVSGWSLMLASGHDHDDEVCSSHCNNPSHGHSGVYS